jgi:hypothetical protein
MLHAAFHVPYCSGSDFELLVIRLLADLAGKRLSEYLFMRGNTASGSPVAFMPSACHAAKNVNQVEHPSRMYAVT